jgi:hypothetical protein
MEEFERMLKRRVLAGIAAILMGASLVFAWSASAHNISLEGSRETAREYARQIRFATASTVVATSPLGAAEIERDESSAFAAVEGAIEKVWVEYGIKVKGETGIRIHTKFSVKNALNVQCVIQASVQRSDGHSFLSSPNTYATKDGKAVLISKPFIPPFDPTVYPDTRLFIPYWALKLVEENPNKMKLFVTLSSGGKEFVRSSVVDLGVALGKAR